MQMGVRKFIARKFGLAWIIEKKNNKVGIALIIGLVITCLIRKNEIQKKRNNRSRTTSR
jgi:hypothetical protein